MNSTRLSFLVTKILNNTRARGNVQLLFKLLTRNPIFRTLPKISLGLTTFPNIFPKLPNFQKWPRKILRCSTVHQQISLTLADSDSYKGQTYVNNVKSLVSQFYVRSISIFYVDKLNPLMPLCFSSSCDFQHLKPLGSLSAEETLVSRQAYAGLLWSKQFYYYVIQEWLKGDPNMPRPPSLRSKGRNSRWKYLRNKDIISMPDKWEYPWVSVKN